MAGGAALAVAKKVGIIGILLLVLKKGAFVLLAGLGGAFAWLRRLFGGTKDGGSGTAGGLPQRPRVDAEPDPGLAPIPQEGADAVVDADRPL